MKKYRIGYTQGVFDMFHIGHLNLLKHAKEYCEKLIVGVNSDELVLQYKNKQTIIDEKDRCEIVRNIKQVDEAHIVNSLDKVEQHSRFRFDVIFVGDDWKGNERWKKTVLDLKGIGVDVIFLPYTKDTSSTILRSMSNSKVDEDEKGD